MLAGLLGLLAHAGEAPDEYLRRVRLLFLGSVALGYLGAAALILRTTGGWRRWGALVLALAATRVCYVPVLAAAFLLAGWCDWCGRLFGAQSLGGPIHYALACFTAAGTTLVALGAVAAAAHIKRPGGIVTLVLLAATGVLVFWNPVDRKILPHPMAEDVSRPATTGPGYLDVVEDRERSTLTRIFAAGSGVRHALSPRSGWGGRVREEMLARFQGNPELSLGERVTSLEAALLTARATFETSPRTPPE
ncbi:MAG: hypothetical protein ACYTFD_14550 [Planctomycetota bacterium]